MLFNLFIFSITLIIFVHDVEAQSRMKNTQSSSEVIRNTNPDSINSIGKIEGNEVQRNQVPSNQGSQSQRLYVDPTPNPDDEFYDEEFDDLPDEDEAHSGISTF